MLRSDDFEEASKKFRQSIFHFDIFSRDKWINAVFKAEFVKQTASIKFIAIVFDTGYKTPELKKVKVALILENEMLEWVIKIQVFEKEREDKE